MPTQNSTLPLDANGQPYHRTWFVLTLLVGTFTTFITQTLLTTAFPTLMADFHISATAVQWLTTGFMLIMGIMIPVSAWLLTRINSKYLYLTAMLIFGLGTTLAYFAVNFQMLLIARMIQAMGVGISAPVFQTIMSSVYPPEKRGSAMGTAGIVIGLAPAIGPTLSGWIIDNYSWRALFLFILPINILVIIVSFFTLRKVLPTSKQPIDWWSVLISTIGFGSMLYGFSSVGNAGWGDPVVLTTLVIGLIFIGLFVWRQLHMDQPLLELRVFKIPAFTLSAILTALAYMAMMGVEMILPMYIQTVLGRSAMDSGLILLPGAIMMGIMSPITGRIFDHIGARRLAMTGMLLLTLGTAFFLSISATTPILWIIVVYAIRMFGLTMVTMPVTTTGINALPFRLISHGTAANNTLRQVAASMGTAVLISVYSSVAKWQMPGHQLLTQAPLKYRQDGITATLTGYHMAFVVSLIFVRLALGLPSS
ncbi:multidrug transport protein [Lactiplantibacillus plantarum]|uniref:MDR family MFS transporter n=1 Tax=Lactiplantibacillus plantarum TaxID=1590 RepID=UPI001C733E42|nr:multidrug efflux MFS transporter [Lactiplantibacillus plantarum]MCG0697201.1 multidrug transport protein [Lactiplantibacillus plantarum]MCG0700188.1 multidrug transport protein [Lactiplantibacillus plantarum]MCG0703177.1 multidrug transport protein [Lactiplantibacillus plantarum]MCG0706131.1 multidrug transport protein [Lactiplantibacillus plantarum]